MKSIRLGLVLTLMTFASVAHAQTTTPNANEAAIKQTALDYIEGWYEGNAERMEKALRAAGVPVETLYFPTEGHGFYTDEHQRAFYAQLLAFLDRNIGVPAGSAAAAASP